jgi:uncharacterized membrane protein YidH (DUF202 family)
MTEQVKSLIRHTLTAIGVLLTLIGIDKFIPLVEYLQTNLDGVVAAVSTLVGVFVTIIGFFRDSERWEKQEDQE